jgi:hypothetical protein
MRLCVIAGLGAAVLASFGFAQDGPERSRGAAALAPAQTSFRLSDAEFRALVTRLSEPGGTFVTENIVSNEIAFQDVLPELQRRTRQGAYIGVAPEQNLSYIAALKPPIAFIVDLQRGNLLLQLLYKALVETSSDRADFMSHLFARARPAGVNGQASAADLFAAYRSVRVSTPLAATTLSAVLGRLNGHGFSLSAADRRGIEKIHRAIYEGGPDLRGDFGRNVAIPSWVPSYAEMLSQADPNGVNQSFLGSEANFSTLKAYESDNLIVPVVGDFAGDKALKAVGEYVRGRGITVGTFYTSNVEDYLFRSDAWTRFFRNVASLPLDDDSMFVRTYFTSGIEGMREYVAPIRSMLSAWGNGEIKSYDDLIARSRVPRS